MASRRQRPPTLAEFGLHWHRATGRASERLAGASTAAGVDGLRKGTDEGGIDGRLGNGARQDRHVTLDFFKRRAKLLHGELSGIGDLLRIHRHLYSGGCGFCGGSSLRDITLSRGHGYVIGWRPSADLLADRLAAGDIRSLRHEGRTPSRSRRDGGARSELGGRSLGGR